jgi:hypothetical protein
MSIRNIFVFNIGDMLAYDIATHIKRVPSWQEQNAGSGVEQ